MFVFIYPFLLFLSVCRGQLYGYCDYTSASLSVYQMSGSTLYLAVPATTCVSVSASYNPSNNALSLGCDDTFGSSDLLDLQVDTTLSTVNIPVCRDLLSISQGSSSRSLSCHNGAGAMVVSPAVAGATPTIDDFFPVLLSTENVFTKLDEPRGRLLVSAGTQGLLLVNLLTRSSTQLLTRCGSGYDLLPSVLDEATGTFYASCGTDGIYSISFSGAGVATATLFSSLTPYDCFSPTAMYWSASKQRLFAVCLSVPNIVRINVATMHTTLVLNEDSPTTWGCAPDSLDVATRLVSRSIIHDELNDRVYASCPNEGGIVEMRPDALTGQDYVAHLLVDSQSCRKPSGLFYAVSTGVVYLSCGTSGTYVRAPAFRCTPGTYWTPGNVCAACPKHSFRSALSQSLSLSSCSLCARGSITSNEGSVACEPCAKGEYERDRVCLKCQPGTAQNQTGQTQCNQCPIGNNTQHNNNATRQKRHAERTAQENEGKEST